jgi:hypothetical protein
VVSSFSGKISSLIDTKSNEIDPFEKKKQQEALKELRKKKTQLQKQMTEKIEKKREEVKVTGYTNTDLKGFKVAY